MDYFKNKYKSINYPLASKKEKGLYNAQIGAIHAIASHFTISSDTSIITMPTGSGKTAVLMMVPYVLKAKRVLVLTPSRMVRDQIRYDFENLHTLKKIGVIKNNIKPPSVYEIKSKINSNEKWENLKKYNVIISTPNCISPAIADIPNPPIDLFDVVLIDEAHHSPAKTWNEIIKTFSSAKKVLFTATPFRRDKREIKGKFVFNYPLARAYEDNIFGNIEYVPVNENGEYHNNDIAIAKKAEETYLKDKKNGLKHYLMVRTDGKKRASDLLELYEQNTKLKLRLIHSGFNFKYAKETIEQLKKDEIDGIVCVNMLGEGFNFPNLKIAAIHTPHKSLEITLQFIGRFARTNVDNIGQAKFIAVPNEIEIEGEELFKKGAIWQELIINLSHLKIEDEVETREVIQHFDNPLSFELNVDDLSLYSLLPRNHVKIFHATKNVDIFKEIKFKDSQEVIYRNDNEEDSSVVLITREITKPRWSSMDEFIQPKYTLIIIYHDKKNKLVFINSSQSTDYIYQEITKIVAPGSRMLATSEINHVLNDLDNPSFFNIGMRNRALSSNKESYRIIAGSNTAGSIQESDSHLYRQGHAFCTAQVKGEKVTIGFSSSSKVWSSSQTQIPKLLKWCNNLGKKINNSSPLVTNSGFDLLAAGEIISKIPQGIIGADWGKETYETNKLVEVKYKNKENEDISHHISELDIEIDKNETDSDKIVFNVNGDDFSEKIKFSINEGFELIHSRTDLITVLIDTDEISFIDYINNYDPIVFFTSDYSQLRLNEFFSYRENKDEFDQNNIEVIDWLNTNIQNECEADTEGNKSIHTFLKEKLLEDDNNTIILYDHGKGELADFLVVKSTDNLNVYQFYHCKKSGGSTPSSRVGDLSEVCFQAQKSANWIKKISKLREKVKSRCENKEDKFLRGSYSELDKLIKKNKEIKTEYEVFIVQPGLSRSGIDENVSKGLNATLNIILAYGFNKLKIWGSK